MVIDRSFLLLALMLACATVVIGCDSDECSEEDTECPKGLPCSECINSFYCEFYKTQDTRTSHSDGICRPSGATNWPWYIQYEQVVSYDECQEVQKSLESATSEDPATNNVFGTTSYMSNEEAGGGYEVIFESEATTPTPVLEASEEVPEETSSVEATPPLAEQRAVQMLPLDQESELEASQPFEHYESNELSTSTYETAVPEMPTTPKPTSTTSGTSTTMQPTTLTTARPTTTTKPPALVTVRPPTTTTMKPTTSTTMKPTTLATTSTRPAATSTFKPPASVTTMPPPPTMTSVMPKTSIIAKPETTVIPSEVSGTRMVPRSPNLSTVFTFLVPIQSSGPISFQLPPDFIAYKRVERLNATTAKVDAYFNFDGKAPSTKMNTIKLPESMKFFKTITWDPEWKSHKGWLRVTDVDEKKVEASLKMASKKLKTTEATKILEPPTCTNSTSLSINSTLELPPTGNMPKQASDDAEAVDQLSETNNHHLTAIIATATLAGILLLLLIAVSIYLALVIRRPRVLRGVNVVQMPPPNDAGEWHEMGGIGAMPVEEANDIIDLDV